MSGLTTLADEYGLREARPHRAGFRPDGARDSQPSPQAPEAEQAVLGCILLEPLKLKEAREYFGEKRPFYDLRHQAIFEAMLAVMEERQGLDIILLEQWLRDKNQLDQVGGIHYLATLPDRTPSAANIVHYLEMVWEKFLARELLETVVSAGAQVYSADGLPEAVIARIEQRVGLIKQASARHSGLRPPHLKGLDDFENAYWDIWFGKDAGEPGIELPFGFPFKVRRGEQTFLIADKGAGKSTLLSYIFLKLMQHGEKACIASLEVKPAVTIKMMAAQLLGTWRLPDNAWGHTQALAAYEWLRPRLMIYDFLGIGDWRDIKQTFDVAAVTHGCTAFAIDSVMRMGIMDDDLAQQGFAAASFSEWCMARNVANWIVNHLNKSDKSVKQRSRGSQQWIDNSHNVLSVHRNEEKQAKIDELKEQLKHKQIDQPEFDEKVGKMRDKHDSYVDLLNQRWPGSRQNARCYLWFNPDSLQLHERPYAESVNWLEQWKGTTAA